MKKTLLLGALFALTLNTLAQESITLNSLWQRYEFYAGGISGLRSMNDGVHYTAQGKGTIEQYSYKTGEQVGILLDVTALKSEALEVPAFDSYALSEDESWAILETETTPIYRRSSRSVVWLVDLESHIYTTLNHFKSTLLSMTFTGLFNKMTTSVIMLMMKLRIVIDMMSPHTCCV